MNLGSPTSRRARHHFHEFSPLSPDTPSPVHKWELEQRPPGAQALLSFIPAYRWPLLLTSVVVVCMLWYAVQQPAKSIGDEGNRSGFHHHELRATGNGNPSLQKRVAEIVATEPDTNSTAASGTADRLQAAKSVNPDRMTLETWSTSHVDSSADDFLTAPFDVNMCLNYRASAITGTRSLIANENVCIQLDIQNPAHTVQLLRQIGERYMHRYVVVLIDTAIHLTDRIADLDAVMAVLSQTSVPEGDTVIVPSSLFPQNIVRVYATNANVYDTAERRFVPVPLGVPDVGAAESLLAIRKPHRSKEKALAFCGGVTVRPEFRKFNPVRYELITTCQKQSDFVNTTMGRRSRDAYYQHMALFSFVYSPQGDAVDAHRHYEALWLGVVPVVQRSAHAEELAKSLPMVLTDDYSDLTQERLRNALAEMRQTQYDFRMLTTAYWKHRIRSDIRALKGAK